MWDFLGFPEEYQVKKKLDRDKFLRSANLTECEQRKLGLNLERINLLYDIRFPDSSEMMVLETTENIRLGRIGYRLKEYVRGIAQSFPYYCLVIIRYMNSVKILLPIERKNKTDDRRMYVEHMIATGLIRTDCENYDATLILSAMRESIAQSHSAAELCLRWSWDIQKAFGKEFSRVSANDETYRYERETLDKENWNNRIFQNAISVDEPLLDITCLEAEEINSWYDDSELNPDSSYYNEDSDDYEYPTSDNSERDMEEGLLIDFFKENCWPLFLEYQELNYLPSSKLNKSIFDSWLFRYCNACGVVFDDHFKGSLTNVEVREIAAAFYEHWEPVYDDGTFDITELREHLHLDNELYDEEYSEDDYSEDDEDWDDVFSEDD